VATDVDDDEFAVIESLAGLCDKSLVAADPGEGDVRYRLLDSTRAYALERLAAAQETAATMRRHALFLRRSFEHCFDDWTRRSDADFRTRYAPELDDLRSAIAWAFGADGEGDTAIALVASSVRLWLNLSLYAEIDALLRRAEERLTPATPPALRAELSLAAASTSGQRNHQAAIRGARTAAEIYRSLGDELRLGCALHALGSAHAGELDAEAESVLAEARPLLERTGRPRLRAMAHGAIALFHGALGRSDEAIRETHAALALYREGGADNAVLRTLVALADQYWQQGDLERAIAFAGDVLEQHRRSPFADRVSRDYATGNLCGMLVEHGELAQARELARPLLPELAELNILHGWADHFASLLARGGRIADAVRLVGWADAIRSAKGLRRQPNEQRAREGVLAMANEDQSTAAVERLLAEGSRLDAQAACRLASP
jgi:tetratricopeptide (TPR) repeat protein